MFTKAIVRKPGRNFAAGITTSSLGKPDPEKALQQHDAYCKALAACGIELFILEADELYPDGCFVEDTAVVTEVAAIITRPGAESRRGEEKRVSEVLSRFIKIENITWPGTLEGGDIMRVNNHFFIGLSGRTNKEGARQLSLILSKYGYTSSEVSVETVPHLKSGISYPGKDHFIAIEEFALKFSSSKIIRVSSTESYSSNILNVNDSLFIPSGFPEAREKLDELHFRIIELEMSEFRKMDGALTCLSILL